MGPNMRTLGFVVIALAAMAACSSSGDVGGGSPLPEAGALGGASGAGAGAGAGAAGGGAGASGSGGAGGSGASAGGGGRGGRAGNGGGPMVVDSGATNDARAGTDASADRSAGDVMVPDAGTCKPTTESARSWCDPATWAGTVPTATTDVVVQGEVVVDCVAHAKTVHIPAGATLKAARDKASVLTLHGNLLVHGRLDYGTPDDRICASTSAEIVFQGMIDENYVGTPNPPAPPQMAGVFREPEDVPLSVVDSDFGLWVMGSGVFSAAGQPKRAWSKLTEGTGPGDLTLTVEDAAGWLPNDRIALTPTAESSVAKHASQFDEATIATVADKMVTLSQAPAFPHAGCTACIRRGEALNLSRNVVVRSFDTTAHAHMIAGERGVLQLDSVELRWLGPQKKCSGGAPFRRSPIHFHQQRDASDPSFVRHVSIWGGKNHFLMQERSNGVEVVDVAGYDTVGSGFMLFYDNWNCGTRCVGDAAPRNTVLTSVIAAKVAVPERASGCAAIGAVVAIAPSGSEGTGCVGCVATGTAYNYGIFGNIGAIQSAEGGAGRPTLFTLNGNVAHNNAAHGISNWQNTDVKQPAYDGNQTWSNGGNGVHHGAYGNSFGYTNLVSQDNLGGDFAVIAAEGTKDHVRVDGAILDGFKVLGYFAVPGEPVIIKNATFTGKKNPAISQVHDACSGGDENDPQDSVCIRNWLRFDTPQIPHGIKPFEFGGTSNKHAKWEVRNFIHADYPSLPKNFDLYRKDNQVAGGAYNADFDAWLVPQ
jgi:hypothetical protein